MLMESDTNHGAQIPQITGQSDISVELSLTLNSNLIMNQLYSTIITTISGDEEVDSIGAIEFSMSCISIS